MQDQLSFSLSKIGHLDMARESMRVIESDDHCDRGLSWWLKD
jgi:hypothetical protein